MTREELYASLYQNGTVYRPLQEEKSILLEVALGCSWHKCAFCDFTRDHFELLPLETIRRNAEQLAALQPQGNRVFLLGQNAFVRPAQDLLQIFGYVHHYLPQVNQLSMYARADDVNRKSTEELRLLKQMGLCDLHIGVESGSDTVLMLANKGETAEELLRCAPSANWMKRASATWSLQFWGWAEESCGRPTPSRRPASTIRSIPATSGCWGCGCSLAPSFTGRPGRAFLSR